MSHILGGDCKKVESYGFLLRMVRSTCWALEKKDGELEKIHICDSRTQVSLPQLKYTSK